MYSPGEVNDRYISIIPEIKPQILKYTEYLQDFVTIKIEYWELYNNILTNKKTTLKVFKSMDYDYNKKERVSAPKELVLKIDNYNWEEFKIYNSLYEKNSDKQYKLWVWRYSIELFDSEIYDNWSKDYLSSRNNNNHTYFMFVPKKEKTWLNITMKNISIEWEDLVFEYCNNWTIDLSDNEYWRSWVDVEIHVWDNDNIILGRTGYLFNRSTLKPWNCEKNRDEISHYELNSNINFIKGKTYNITWVARTGRVDDNEYDNILTKSLIIK